VDVYSVHNHITVRREVWALRRTGPVTTYRTRILQKLGLGSNADLVRYALEHELLTAR
jgi:hypothetical protein